MKEHSPLQMKFSRFSNSFGNYMPFVVVVLTVLSGCGASELSQIGAFKDATATTDAAMKLLDVNADGSIDEQELQACPGLRFGAFQIDKDRDQAISRDELLARFEALGKMSDIVGVNVVIVKDGRPVPDATVTFTPAPFLGEGLQSYRGVSNKRGSCALAGETVQLPGLPTGYYTAKITNAAAGIDRELGCEISDDASGSRIQLNL